MMLMVNNLPFAGKNCINMLVVAAMTTILEFFTDTLVEGKHTAELWVAFFLIENVRNKRQDSRSCAGCPNNWNERSMYTMNHVSMHSSTSNVCAITSLISWWNLHSLCIQSIVQHQWMLISATMFAIIPKHISWGSAMHFSSLCKRYLSCQWWSCASQKLVTLHSLSEYLLFWLKLTSWS